MDYSRVIIHPRFIHYFTLRQASTRSTGTPCFLSCLRAFRRKWKMSGIRWSVSAQSSHAAESKSNLRCSRRIGNSFRLRRLTPSSFAVKYGWDDGRHREEGREGAGFRRVVKTWRLAATGRFRHFLPSVGNALRIENALKKINQDSREPFLRRIHSRRSFRAHNPYNTVFKLVRDCENIYRLFC